MLSDYFVYDAAGKMLFAGTTNITHAVRWAQQYAAANQSTTVVKDHTGKKHYSASYTNLREGPGLFIENGPNSTSILLTELGL